MSKKLIENQILILSGMGKRELNSAGTAKIFKLNNPSNIFVMFSLQNSCLSNEYSKFIEKSIKGNLNNEFNELIENVKKNKIINSRKKIMDFQHKLYIDVGIILLNHYYNMYQNLNIRNINFNLSFQNFLIKVNENKNFKIFDFFDNDLFITENPIEWERKLKESFMMKKKIMIDTMDIQITIYTDNMLIPSWILNLEKSWEFPNKIHNVQSGLYNINIENNIDDILPNNKNNINFSNLLELKGGHYQRSPTDSDINYLNEIFDEWYCGKFEQSLYPSKQEILNYIVQNDKPQFISIKENIIGATLKNINDYINDNPDFQYRNNTILMLICESKIEKPYKPRGNNLSQIEQRLFEQQGLIIDDPPKRRYGEWVTAGYDPENYSIFSSASEFSPESEPDIESGKSKLELAKKYEGNAIPVENKLNSDIAFTPDKNIIFENENLTKKEKGQKLENFINPNPNQSTELEDNATHLLRQYRPQDFENKFKHKYLKYKSKYLKLLKKK